MAAASLGFSQDRLQKIDRFIADRYIGPGKIPCAQIQVLRGGELAHEAVLGMADVERGRKLEADAIFRIYSMTKPITSIALMMLVEEGAIALDDPVHRHIPDWKDLGVFQAGLPGQFLTTVPERPMQVVDLLRHTSGLTYGFQNRTNVDSAYRKLKVAEVYGGRDLAGFIAQLAELPLEFSPGTAWNYSVSTDVVGYLVGKVSGMAFEDFLKTRIFEPLGMADTGFHVRPGEEKRLAACYQALPGGGMKLQDDPEKSPYLAPPTMVSGGGGLVSTAADYARFCRMLLNRGELDGARLIAPRTLALMTANHLPGGTDLTQMSRSLFSESTNAGVGFGLGFATVFEPARTLLPSSRGEYYWGGMASTAFWVDPVEEVAVVFMTQLMPSSTYAIRRELRTLVYSALMETNG
ncbi:MAG: serine hydrolase domain-containing protein [Phenylobacterium sp.]|uniref:serine hydrolase domain-containing protein n=1 Tax=Phenylobacterium sp. TaxID=1871053 RepID=UPI00391D20D8